MKGKKWFTAFAALAALAVICALAGTASAEDMRFMVQFFTDENLEGDSGGWEVDYDGDRAPAGLRAYGITELPDYSISSLRVIQGLTVTCYDEINLQGNSKVFTGGPEPYTEYMNLGEWDNRIMSYECKF